MVWLLQRYFWIWDVDDRSGLAEQGVPVNPQTGFTYVFIEGSWMVAEPVPSHDPWLELIMLKRRQTPLLLLESGPQSDPLGTSSSATQASFISFSSSFFHNLVIQLVLPARAWV